MKKLIAFTAILICSLQLMAQRITIPKNYEGGKAWYYKNGGFPAKPGDTVVMKGDYNYIYINNLIGTAEKPIVFVADGVVNIGVDNSYSMILGNSKFVKVVGNNFNIVFGAPAGKPYSKQAFGFHGSEELEVSGVRLRFSEVGFFSNPTTGNYKNINLHHNWIHDLDNPSDAGRSEAFYIGATSLATRKNGGSFENVTIADNILENLAGDGIQVALTNNLKILRNKIKGYGKANLNWQRTAIIVGGVCSNSLVQDNSIESGTGSPFQYFGTGTAWFNNNTAIDCATSANEDGFYIGNRGTDSIPKVHITNNKINKVARSFIREEKTGVVITNTGNQFGGVVIPPVVVPPVRVDSVTKASFDSLNNVYNVALQALVGCNNLYQEAKAKNLELNAKIEELEAWKKETINFINRK